MSIHLLKFESENSNSNAPQIEFKIQMHFLAFKYNIEFTISLGEGGDIIIFFALFLPLILK